MKRIRNPRFAPELLERKLCPSTVAANSGASAIYSSPDPSGNVGDQDLASNSVVYAAPVAQGGDADDTSDNSTGSDSGSDASDVNNSGTDVSTDNDPGSDASDVSIAGTDVSTDNDPGSDASDVSNAGYGCFDRRLRSDSRSRSDS